MHDASPDAGTRENSEAWLRRDPIACPDAQYPHSRGWPYTLQRLSRTRKPNGRNAWVGPTRGRPVPASGLRHPPRAPLRR